MSTTTLDTDFLEKCLGLLDQHLLLRVEQQTELATQIRQLLVIVQAVQTIQQHYRYLDLVNRVAVFRQKSGRMRELNNGLPPTGALLALTPEQQQSIQEYNTAIHLLQSKLTSDVLWLLPLLEKL